MALEIASLNRLRRSVRNAWDADGDRPRPLIELADEDGDREEIGEAFRTISSEMGMRYIRIDLASGLTPEHEAALAKAARNPRLIVLTSIDGVPEDQRAGLHDRLCADAARTIPIIVCFLPADAIATTLAAWRRLKEIEARGERTPDA